jgi:hypothetical protein
MRRLRLPTHIPRQQGAVLITALMLLIAGTLLALSSINGSTVSLKIIRSTEMALEAEEVAQSQIEQLLDGDLSNWSTTNQFPVSAPHYQGTVKPTCLGIEKGGGASSSDLEYRDLVESLPASATLWDLRAELTETDTGAMAVVHQGVIWPESSGAVCPSLAGP